MKLVYVLIGILMGATLQAQTDLEATEDSALVHFAVTDKKQVPEAHVKVILVSTDSKIKKEVITDVSGMFDILLPEGKKYKIMAKKYGKDFEFDDILDIPVMDGTVEVEQKVVIHVKYDVSNLITLNIHFESGKWDLNEQAKSYIDKHLLTVLNKDKSIKIEIAGHTDDVGDDARNIKLSQNRAGAVRDYLYSQGIEHERVAAKGYGETQPKVPNTSPENRSKNRRIEAKILTLEEKTK